MAKGAYLLYHYSPSKAAAIAFIAIFSITTILHAFQLIRKRTWYFIPFLIGGIFESIGYVGRTINANQPYDDWTLGPYILATLTLLLAPALFAASIYMVLGRLILLVDGAHLSPIRPSRLTKIFVAGDVLSFLAQSGGGGILSNAKKQSAIKLGQNVITGGLALQIIFFGLFMIVTFVFHRRIKKNPTSRSQQLDVSWEGFLYVLYAASSLILVRSVFRIAEYVMGQNGYLLDHEYFLYIFDSTLMFLVMVIFNVHHPSKIIGSSKAQGHTRDLESSDSGFELHSGMPRK